MKYLTFSDENSIFGRFTDDVNELIPPNINILETSVPHVEVTTPRVSSLRVHLTLFN